MSAGLKARFMAQERGEAVTTIEQFTEGARAGLWPLADPGPEKTKKLEEEKT